ncbi:MAG TPA: HAD-IB family hydrolase [Steroidobacteraceae bacterium]|jgi:phosphatidylglycerophosphatase C|nr:HAD-IB family hydrolase [Steroidobacteraceae bacterium]
MSAAAAAGVAVFDLDGTITRADTLAPFLLQCLRHAPWRLPRLLAALPAALRFPFDRDRGALKGALIHAALGGLPRARLSACSERFVARLLRHGVYREALEAIDAHRVQGDRLVLMSASTDLYVPQIAHALGFHEAICTRVRWHADGRLDGRLASANCREMEKRRQLLALIERLGPVKVYTYGNSSADLPHMQLAQEAVLVNGPSRLRRSSAAGLRHVRWGR